MKILHAPLHGPSAKKNPSAVKQRIRQINPHSAGLTEAYSIIPALASTQGYRMILESGGRDTRRGQKDNPILTRKNLRALGSGQVFAAEKSTPVKIAPERWITFSVFKADGLVVNHLCLHPHAAVQHPDTGRVARHDRGKRFIDQVEALDRLVWWSLKQEMEVAVTADMNFRDRDGVDEGPYAALRGRGLNVMTEGIDAVAWTPALKMRVFEVRSAASNHPWLLAQSR